TRQEMTSMAGKRKQQKSLAELAWGIRPLLRLAAQYSATSQELLKLAKGLEGALGEVVAEEKPTLTIDRKVKASIVRKIPRSKRKPMSEAKRRHLSQLQKKRWAERKAKAA